MKNTNINTKYAVAILIVMLASMLSACNNNHTDRQIEAEHTNQVQIHESGLTERSALTSALVDNAIDSMNDK